MSPLAITLLGVILLPLFAGRWRVSLAGLSVQGLLLFWISWLLHPSLETTEDWLRLVDLLVVRAGVAPLLLLQVLKRRQETDPSGVLPANLILWTLALVAVLVAFSLAGALVPEAGTQQTLVAVAMAALLLAFLVLATTTSPFGQIVGALRLENAIALFELSGPQRAEPLPLRVGQLAIVVGTVVMFRWYLAGLGAVDGAPPADAIEGPEL